MAHFNFLNILNIKIALRYLFSKQSRSADKNTDLSFSNWFPIIGLALSVAVLIIVMSVSNGFRIEMVKRILGFTGHICIYNGNGSIENYENLLTEIKSQKDIINAYPLIKQQIIISASDATGAMLHGVTMDDLRTRQLIRDSISTETIARFEADKDSIIIGSKLAENLRIKVGDKVMILCPQEKKLNLAMMVPKIKYMTVAGTFDVGMNDYNAAFVFVHIKTAEKMFNMVNKISEIDVFISDPDMTTKYIEKIEEVIEDLDLTYQTTDWQSMNETFLSAINMQKIVMLIVFCMVILIATFSTIASIVTMVQRKSKEIAILRTIGATRLDILKIFLIAGKIIGIIGISIGFISGILISTYLESIIQLIEKATRSTIFDDNVYALSTLPCIIDFSDTFTICGLAFLLTSFAAIYPAWRASKIEPTNVLRHE